MAMRHFPSIWQGSTLGHQIDRTLSVHRDSFDATQDRGGIRLRGRLQAHCRRGGSGWRLPGVAQGSTNRGMGGVAGCHTVPISSTKVSITSQIGAGRGAVRPGFERGRLVIANVAVQECRLGEFVRGGMTCRHEKAKDLLGKLIAKQGDQITCLGRGSCHSGGCDQARRERRWPT